MALVTYDDLTAPALSNPARKVFEVALARMQSTTSPMPPGAPLAAEDFAAFTAWANAGAPRTSCAPDVADGGRRDANLPECVLSSDCPGVLVCRAGVCDVECVTNKDCTATWTCEETRCVPPSRSPGVDAGDRATYGDLTSTGDWSVTNLAGLPTGSYDGSVFDGRYMYFAPDGAVGTALRYDTKLAFGSLRAWSTFDLLGLNADAKYYRGAAFDGRYVYLVPGSAAGKVARFDTASAYRDPASWTIFDANTLGAHTGFMGATFDGRYLYFVPATRAAVAFRYDTQGTMTSPSSWSTFAIPSVDAAVGTFAGAVFDGRYLYYVPSASTTGPQGIIARYDVEAPFGLASSWKTLDLSKLEAKATGFKTGAFDGRYLYLVPGWSSSPTPWWTSTIARYDTQSSFDAQRAWTFFDTTGLDPNAAGFNAAAFDGRRLILAPGFNATGSNGLMLGLDTQGELTGKASWSVFDSTSLASSVRNMRGASFDGRYVYLAPNYGVAARFDARSSATETTPSMRGGSFF
jgi:hypothetical protein